MGYYCVFIQVRESALRQLEGDRILDLFERGGSPASRRTSLLTLGLFEGPAMAHEIPPPISLEEMWLALHHLLTGELRPDGSPLSRAILGGTSTQVEVGDGPVRYLRADEVRETSEALSSLTVEDVRRRFDPRGLKAAWPMTPATVDEEDEALLADLEGDFRLPAAYYRIAAASGNAILIGVV